MTILDWRNGKGEVISWFDSIHKMVVGDWDFSLSLRIFILCPPVTGFFNCKVVTHSLSKRRSHGNEGRIPHNVVTAKDGQTIADFVIAYANKHGCPVVPLSIPGSVGMYF